MLFKGYVAGLLSLFCCAVVADDTELFVADLSAQNGIRPQVLIIFDTSGSMRASEDVIPEPYDSGYSYGAGENSGKIYWTKSGKSIPKPNSANFFLSNKNNCQASISLLASEGVYNGNLRRWVPKSNSSRSRWKTLSRNYGDLFECKEDMLKADASNPATPADLGFPKDGRSGPYVSTVNNVFSGSDAVTLYSANYIYWYQNAGQTRKSRLNIAKDSIASLIRSTPSVDFGLAVFNHNTSNLTNGGRIVDKVMLRDTVQSESLINKVGNLIADGNTPLCESMYEAYRYYAGKSVYYGDDDISSLPGRDVSAENSGVYLSPFKTCQERAYIILMTDGKPTSDGDANTLVNALTGNGAIENSYMPTLAQWMNNFDIDGNEVNGKQHVTTYTIGFGQAAVDYAGILLNETAVRGGGEYYPAASSATLQQAFQATILDILNSSSSLSSPAIANNNFDRTRSLDSVYYSMFMPSNKSVWQGNIKKLTMNSAGILVDRLGAPAINADGNIKDNASTYWGGDQDGNAVAEGGIAAMLGDTIIPRRILSDLSESTLLEPNLSNLKTYYEVTTEAQIASQLGVAEADLADSLNWLKGLDINDENSDNSVTDYRSDIFADPLHSKPLAITYTEGENQVVRLLVGTNAGFLHMFTDNGDAVIENWAFIPEQLLTSTLTLMDPPDTINHHYGMDLSPVAIKIYESGSLQKIIAIVGMRRGGGSYYALDITDPDAPKLAWKIDSSDGDFAELAQTWSMPTIGVFSYNNGSVDKVTPGIVFGGGYDTNKDSCIPSESESCNDETGRAVYIADAVTGDFIWSANGTTCASDDADKHCMRDSIPSKVSLLDSDDDGYTDRIYAGDTGGNIWRMDLVGSDRSKWSTLKLANLGGDTAISDRRFFTAPVIVRSFENNIAVSETDQFSYNKVPYDGLLIGSGDRMLKMLFICFMIMLLPPLYLVKRGFLKKRIPLLRISFMILPVILSLQILNVFAEMSALSGWQYRFTSEGEKSLGQGAVLEGTVYFTSFVPNSTVNIGCGVGDLGTGWLYAVDLHSGVSRLNNDQDEVVAKKDIGSRVPDSLVIHAGVDEQGNSVIRLLGVGQGDQMRVINDETLEEEIVHSGTVDTQTDMMPRRIYSYFKER